MPPALPDARTVHGDSLEVVTALVGKFNHTGPDAFTSTLIACGNREKLIANYHTIPYTDSSTTRSGGDIAPI